MITDIIVMWETRLSIVYWVYSKTQILLVTLKMPSQPRVEADVSSQVEHVSPHFVCARSKHQCLTVQLNLKFFLWTLVFTWTVSPLSISDIWLLKYCILLSTQHTHQAVRDHCRKGKVHEQVQGHPARGEIRGTTPKTKFFYNFFFF